MSDELRRGWPLVATIFVILLLVLGGALDDFSIFLMPLVRELA